MDDAESGRRRRRFLAAAGSIVTTALAGCSGDDEIDEEDLPERPDDQNGSDREPGYCLDELDQEVPADLATAESIGGVQRDPEDLVSKEEAGYQCSPNGSNKCTSCRYFVEGGGIDGPSACARVEGLVRTTDWCELHERAEPVEEAIETEAPETDTPTNSTDTPTNDTSTTESTAE